MGRHRPEMNQPDQNISDILCFSSTDWEGIWGSRQQVMLRFARRGYRVLFIEQLAGVEHLVRYPELYERKRRRWQEGLRNVAENLNIISAPPLFPGRYYVMSINKINTWITNRWIRNKIQSMVFESPILWFYKPEHCDLVGKFNERISIYHCIDEWTAGTSGRKRKIIAQLDSNLVSKVDVVFANSLLTYEKKIHSNPNTFRIRSGVDFEHFVQAANPHFETHPALADIPKPRIGFSGTINERLDYTYLEHLATNRPDWSLVFIGDTFPWTFDAAPLRKLSTFSNVHFLGKFPFSTLPSLIRGLDVCLIPYVNDERGSYRSPLKLYEYLAAGKPIVSTNHPEVHEFSPPVLIANTPGEFIENVEIAIAQNSPKYQQKSIDIAKQHSWDLRVEQMESIINRTLKEKV